MRFALAFLLAIPTPLAIGVRFDNTALTESLFQYWGGDVEARGRERFRLRQGAKSKHPPLSLRSRFRVSQPNSISFGFHVFRLSAPRAGRDSGVQIGLSDEAGRRIEIGFARWWDGNLYLTCQGHREKGHREKRVRVFVEANERLGAGRLGECRLDVTIDEGQLDVWYTRNRQKVHAVEAAKLEWTGSTLAEFSVGSRAKPEDIDLDISALSARINGPETHSLENASVGSHRWGWYALAVGLGVVAFSKYLRDQWSSTT